ncbi:hypothetical protein BKA62DRAFT_774260 [Auriculariales sp. MPI-PUGE-AT-0066]|nr:hypothetical protein BKA62DRAFT_774260 [Auriculariales sp. MPI-PUGE-AT-0066]
MSAYPPLTSTAEGRESLVELLLQHIGTVALGGIFYGFHVILMFGISYSVLPNLRRRWATFSLALFLFIISSVLYFLGIRIVVAHVKALKDPDSLTLFTFMDTLEWVRCALFILSMLVGDAILSWRVIVLYQRKFWIVAVQGAALLTGFGLGLASITCMLRAADGYPFPETPHCTEIVFKGQQAAWTISLFLNLFSTVQLGRIAWSHQHMLHKSGIRRNAIVTILYILAVSSAVYCILWIPLVSLLFWQFSAQSYFFGSRVFAMNLLQSAFQQLVGIYPTLVTFLTLNNNYIFGQDSAASTFTSSRTRQGTITGSTNFKVAAPASYVARSMSFDNAIVDIARSPPASAKAFLPMVVEDSTTPHSAYQEKKTHPPGFDVTRVAQVQVPILPGHIDIMIKGFIVTKAVCDCSPYSLSGGAFVFYRLTS